MIKIKRAKIAEWIRYDVFDNAVSEGWLLGPEANVGPHSFQSAESLEADRYGMLWATVKKRDENGMPADMLWVFPAGTWHGEPVDKPRGPGRPPRKDESGE